jgi:ABC-type Mn2+/Zn2+ transport system ATPase subunit
VNIGYGEFVIVPGVAFDLAAGGSLALVGVNGSGKSTLLKSLAGVIPLLLGDVNIIGKKPGESPREVAYLSQFHSSGFILPLLVRDVVRMGRYAAHGLLGRFNSVDDDRIDDAIRRMGIEPLANRPLGALSGGQQQRVYIAQALAKQARVYLMDEPTSGLDSAGKELYAQAMRRELECGAALVVATHDLQEAQACSQAMLLAHKIVALGPGREVMTPQLLLETFGIDLPLAESVGDGVVAHWKHV